MELDFLEASLLILKPKQPFLDWINATYPDTVMTLEGLEDEECGHATYLIPYFEELPKAKRWVRTHYKVLFESKLADWSLDENHWPENLTYKHFSEWFDIEFNLMVFDLRKTKGV